MVDPFVWWCVGVLTLATTAQTACTVNGTCSSHWVHFCSSCYRFQSQPVNHSTARVNCETEGGYLAFIEDETEDQFISNRTTNESWIGLTTNITGDDRGCNGSYTCNRLMWMWYDGSPVEYTNWQNISDTVEPTGDSPCVRMISGGWADLKCEEIKHYVCEKTAINSSDITATTTTTFPSSTTYSPTDASAALSTTMSTTTRVETPATATTPSTSTSTDTIMLTSTTSTSRRSTSMQTSSIPNNDDKLSGREKMIYVVVAGVVAAVLIPILAITAIYIQHKRKSQSRTHKIDGDNGGHMNQRGHSDSDQLGGKATAEVTPISQRSLIKGHGVVWDQQPEAAASSNVTGLDITAESRDADDGNETTSAVDGTHNVTGEDEVDEFVEFSDPTYAVVGKCSSNIESDVTHPETVSDQEEHIYAKPIKRPSTSTSAWDMVENDLYGT